MQKDNTKLDRLDLKILEIMQRECRITNLYLAKWINLSPTPCLERAQLEQNGYIDKYVAHLNPAKLNMNLTAYIPKSPENARFSGNLKVIWV